VPEAIQQINEAVSLVIPEIILLATVCILFLVGPLMVSEAGEARTGLRHRWGILALLALGTAIFAWLRGEPGQVSGGPFVVDQLVWFTRGLSLSAGVLLVMLLWNQIDDGHSAEAFACLLAIIAGTNLVAAANDLVMLFLALELVSIPTYVLLYLPRRDQLAREATVKYFLLSVFSSALVLYGMSWLYGAAGTTNLTGIADVLAQAEPGGQVGVLRVAFALLVAGLCFRITAVPFHFYAPDVFQGTTASNAALLSFVPKIVGFVALLRLIPLTGATATLHHWVPVESARTLLAILAVVTMFVGNLMALRQVHLYRLMAYSSVAHAGYMLVGLAIGNVQLVGGTNAVLFYLAAYGLMTLGVFALLSGVRITGRPLQTDADLRGLSRTNFSVALLLAICLFSLTGLPPTAGFLGKLNLFMAAWSDGTTLGHSLAILMGLNAAIAAWYYLRLIALMFLEPAAETTEIRSVDRMAWLAGAICTAATIGLFIAPQWLWDLVLQATGA
jgi:NADH-quinone oxidoreductase subunit N